MQSALSVGIKLEGDQRTHPQQGFYVKLLGGSLQDLTTALSWTIEDHLVGLCTSLGGAYHI